MKRAIIAFAAVVAGVAASQARIITVDDDNPADFSAIQLAIDDANDGDTVLVADGTYTGDGNRDIDFHGKAITVRSENGPESCIIDCNGTPSQPHRGFCFHTGEGPDSVLSGLTVTNGYAPDGGGIYCRWSSPTIESCIITRNAAELGGGIYWEVSFSGRTPLSKCVIAANRADDAAGIWFMAYASLTVQDCLVIGNSAVHDGGGVAVISGDPSALFTFETCTFADNSAELGGGLFCLEGKFALRNCILWGDAATRGSEIMSDNRNTMPPFTNIDIYYCDLEGGAAGVHGYYGWGNGIYFREGNIDADPCFADLSNGDYHLKSEAGRWARNEERWTTDEVTSLCIDAGDPTTPIGPEPFPNGGRINMGAYAGTAEASKSYFGGSLCETVVAGDVNGDCKVNFLDFAIMAMHWLEER